MKQQEFNNEYYDEVIEFLQEKIEDYKTKKASMEDNGFRLYNQSRLKYTNERIQRLAKQLKTTDNLGHILWLEEQMFWCNKHKLSLIKKLKRSYNYNQNKIKNDQ